MERLFDELVGCCERLLNEEKSGTRERSALSAVTKSLKRYLAEAWNEQKTLTEAAKKGKDGTAGAAPVAPPHPVSSPPAASASPSTSPSPATVDGVRGASLPNTATAGSVGSGLDRSASPQPGSPVALTSSPLRVMQRYISSEEEINGLGYACRIGIIGDTVSGGSGGAIPRGSTKALLAALELAAVLLNSGLLPAQFAAAPPHYEFAQHSSRGAVFLSKLLGGGGASKEGAASATATSNSGGDEHKSSEGTAMTVAARENVRLALVDAVMASADMVLAKESNDKLGFVFITALVAGVVPRVSRPYVSDIRDAQMRSSCLSVHGDRLVKVLQLLFGIFGRPNIFPALIDESRNAINTIARALSKYVEQERTLLSSLDLGGGFSGANNNNGSGSVQSTPSRTSHPADLSTLSASPPPEQVGGSATQQPAALTGLASSPLPPPHGRGGSSVPTPCGVDDMMRVMELCVAVASNAPLTASGASAAGGGAASGTAAAAAAGGGGGAAGCSVGTTSSSAGGGAGAGGEGVSALFQNYPSLISALGVLLHATVNGGPVFRRSEAIIGCIRQSVIPAAIRTSVSGDVDVFRLSLNVLLTCSVTFGGQVVNETSTIFRHVYFRVLDSKFTSTTHKTLVVESFQRFIEEPQLLLGLFLNYDCNTNSQSIYEQMINYLGALAHTSSGNTGGKDSGRPPELMLSVKLEYDVPESLRRKALQALLLVADSNIQWIERCEMEPTESSLSSSSFVHATSHREDDTNGELDAEDAGAAGSAAASQNEAFLQARRYKDALKQFLVLFNDQAKPEAAIESLRDSILLVGTSGEDAAASPGLPTTPTPTPAPAPEEVAGGSAAADVSVEDQRFARQVAVFLREKENYLDKVVLGEYFAKSFRKATSRLLFEEWIKLNDFTGMRLDEALRLFLGGFKLLGEAQVVDSTMELFAAQYCRQNPTVFQSADTAFILSFSICMLNTDAHSPHIKNKMSREGFIKNNQGISEGADLDPALLAGIYDRITQNEIVLRPSAKLVQKPSTSQATSSGGADKGGRFAASIFESIPILRHLTPIAAAITDKVLLPMDVAGNALFGLSERKREELSQQELRRALKEVMDALHASAAAGLSESVFVTANSVENALPMWEVTVDIICNVVVSALERLFEQSEQYIIPPPPLSAAQEKTPAITDPVRAYMRDTQSGDYFQILLRGLTNTVRVCCSFGNLKQTEQLLEQSFEMTHLSQSVVITSQPRPQVTMQQSIPYTRIWLLSVFLNLFVSYGMAFTARGWQAGYAAVSLIDALANGIEGVWRRKANKVAVAVASAESVSNSSITSSSSTPKPQAPRPAPDVWFGQLREVPTSIEKGSLRRREVTLTELRRAPSSAVDLWLERLFDATHYPAMAQLQMTNGLVVVCQKELQSSRTFALTKLFDFVTICASFSSRMQWRELWSNASVVFTMAGKMRSDIANEALNGLRIIALNYLMREELLNYSFQKEVMKPFEEILMSNQEVPIRRRVIEILSELIDFRADHLASGWHVVFSCLSHAAVIPDVTEAAWEVCERVINHHISHMKDCFSDLIFGLTTFSCTNVVEQMPLRGISYLVACGHWLQYGLEAPPSDISDADEITQWATRFRTAEQEARAARSLSRNLPRVTLAPEPLTAAAPLQKPASVTSKTVYHLWMSLFEGMVPIVVVHSSVRVRAHAICSIWALIRIYAAVFAGDVQDSLFSGMLRPVLTTLVHHVPKSGDASFDRFDYRMLVFLALKGMLLSCTDSAHLMGLACETLSTLITQLNFSVDMVQNDLVDVLLRVCEDLVAGVVQTTATTSGKVGGANPANVQVDSTAGSRFDSGDPTSGSFVTAQLMQNEESSSYFIGLLHEAQQTGTVDVVHYKRTAGWTELHHTPAATCTVVSLSPSVQSYATHSLVREAVLHSIEQGLLPRLVSAMMGAREDRAACLLFTQATRHVLLGLAYYCVLTHDMEGIVLLAEFLQVDATPDEAEPPIEYLLLIPYVQLLLDFVFAFPVEMTEVAQRLLREKETNSVERMRRARLYCVDQQRQVQDAIAAAAAAEGPDSDAAKRYKPYKGKSFIDVFRAGRAPLSLRSKYYTTQTPPAIRRRVFEEWLYLMSLLALRCTLSLQRQSALVAAMPREHWLEMIPSLPSAMEEKVVSLFLRSCWEALDLRFNMPEEGTLELCVHLLQSP